MSSMARGLKVTNSICRSILEVSQGTRKQNDELLTLTKGQKTENQKMNTFLQAKIPDIKKYFPIPDTATLRQFLDDSDGLFALKRSEFYNMCSCCAHEKKNLFGTAVLRNFFAQSYINTHIWPTKR